MQTYALMNTLRPTHFTILRQLEGSCTGRGASSRVSQLVKEDLDPGVFYNIAAVITTG